jgi:F-type H+-transporting ATPase subunit alpha
MAVSLFAVNEGYLDDVDVKKVVDFEQALQSYMRSAQGALVKQISETGDYHEEIARELHTAIKEFKGSHSW